MLVSADFFSSCRCCPYGLDAGSQLYPQAWAATWHGSQNLRPISYTDELQTILFRLAWLQRCRHLLEAYVGPEQTGGRFDSTLVSLGILVTLQAKRNWLLPTYCLKADLLQGYDLAWKAAMLLHTRWAGVTGSL